MVIGHSIPLVRSTEVTFEQDKRTLTPLTSIRTVHSSTGMSLSDVSAAQRTML